MKHRVVSSEVIAQNISSDRRIDEFICQILAYKNQSKELLPPRSMRKTYFWEYYTTTCFQVFNKVGSLTRASRSEKSVDFVISQSLVEKSGHARLVELSQHLSDSVAKFYLRNSYLSKVPFSKKKISVQMRKTTKKRLWLIKAKCGI